MVDLPVFPQGADDADGEFGGYKGRRAEQDAASAVPMAPGPLGGVANPAAASGQPDSVGQTAGFGSGNDPVGGPAGGDPSGQPPWGGPVYNPVGAGAAGYGVGQGAPAGSDGADGADGAEYALGAVYGPGAGTPTGGMAMPADSVVPAGYTAPTDGTSLVDGTSLAGIGGATAGMPAAPAAADPAAFTGQPTAPTTAMSSGGPDASTAPAAPADPAGPPDAGAVDDVSFHPSNLDAVLSGAPVSVRVDQPVTAPTAQPAVAHSDPSASGDTASGHTGDDGGSGITVSVDGTEVSSGDGGVSVDIGHAGAPDITVAPLPPAAPAGPPGPAGPSAPPGPSAPTGAGSDGQQAPGQFVHGTGPDAANVELTVDHGALGDGGAQVVRNADGSLDVGLPEAGADGHDVHVHVAPGTDADITVSRDAHGDLLVHATPDSGGDNRTDGGRNQPADPTGPVVAHGDGTGGSAPPTVPNQATIAGTPPAPGPGANTGAGADGAGTGRHPSPGPGGTGGAGTGSGPGPGGTGGPGPGSGGTGGTGTGGTGTGTVQADPDAIKSLGTNLTDHAGPMLDSAHQKAGGISVGFPGFGVLGMPLNMAHDQVRQSAQDYLAAGRAQLDSWRTALNQTANNYRTAEDASTISDG